MARVMAPDALALGAKEEHTRKHQKVGDAQRRTPARDPKIMYLLHMLGSTLQPFETLESTFAPFNIPQHIYNRELVLALSLMGAYCYRSGGKQYGRASKGRRAVRSSL